jgi:hypothetical protein
MFMMNKIFHFRVLALVSIFLWSGLAASADSIAEDLERLKGLNAKLESAFRVSEINFKNDLKSFRAASSEPKKFEIASRLAVQNVFLKTNKPAPFTLSAGETASLNESEKYLAELEFLAKEFDPKLLVGATQCSEADYLALRNSVGLDELNDRATWVMGLASVYESERLPKYIETQRDKIKKDKARFQKYHRLLDTYYAESNGVAGSEDTRRHEIEYSHHLIASGILPKEVRSYVRGLAETSPRCLGRVNGKILKFLRADVTTARGKFILHRIRSQIALGKPVPKDIYDI